MEAYEFLDYQNYENILSHSKSLATPEKHMSILQQRAYFNQRIKPA